MDAEERALLACRAASDRKALDIVVLDLREVSSITDLFLVCSGQNPRQMQAIAEAIDDHLSGQGAGRKVGAFSNRKPVCPSRP